LSEWSICLLGLPVKGSRLVRCLSYKFELSFWGNWNPCWKTAADKERKQPAVAADGPLRGPQLIGKTLAALNLKQHIHIEKSKNRTFQKKEYL